jgi:hypothetical protein
VVHQHHAVGHFQRLFLVVGDEDRGDVQLVVQAAQPAAQLLAHLGVERAEGLVEQQHARLHRQRAGQRDALALAAGELGRKRSASQSSCTSLSSSCHLGLDRASDAGCAASCAGRRPRCRTRHVAEQRVVLEHEAHVALAHVGVGGVGAVEQHLPPSAAPARR